MFGMVHNLIWVGWWLAMIFDFMGLVYRSLGSLLVTMMMFWG